MSANTIARWERGTALPTAARADGLRDLLGISRERVDALVRGTPPPAGAELNEVRIAELEDRIAELEDRIAELEDRIAELEEKCAQPLTSLEDHYGNKITLGPSGIRIESSGEVAIDGSVVEISGAVLKLIAAMTTA